MGVGQTGAPHPQPHEAPQPNIGLQATANSLRSYVAPAIGGA